jgi:hypothetical protein
VPSEYSALSREELELRLRLAEDTCVMFGWCGVKDDSERGKAATELWIRWAHHVGLDYVGPAAHPELAGAEASLARQRDATRSAVITHFFGEPT